MVPIIIYKRLNKLTKQQMYKNSSTKYVCQWCKQTSVNW